MVCLLSVAHVLSVHKCLLGQRQKHKGNGIVREGVSHTQLMSVSYLGRLRSNDFLDFGGIIFVSLNSPLEAGFSPASLVFLFHGCRQFIRTSLVVGLLNAWRRQG